MDREKAFQERILKCVDDTMKSIFGESSRWAVSWHLENDWGIKREEIPRKPGAFTEALNRLFGVGASIVHERLVRAMCSEFQLDEKKVKNFSDAVGAVEGARQGVAPRRRSRSSKA